MPPELFLAAVEDFAMEQWELDAGHGSQQHRAVVEAEFNEWRTRIDQDYDKARPYPDLTRPATLLEHEWTVALSVLRGLAARTVGEQPEPLGADPDLLFEEFQRAALG